MDFSTPQGAEPTFFHILSVAVGTEGDRVSSNQRHIVLIGMPAAGKTRVGALLAKLQGMPFVDLDALVAADSGCTVAQLLRNEGEASFRVREAGLLDAVLDGESVVLSAGGGAAHFHDGLARMRAKATVIWLDADIDTLVERALCDDQERPLLGDTRQDVRASLADLAERRRPVYAGAHLRVDAGQAPNQVVAAIERGLQPYQQVDAVGEDGQPAPIWLHSGDPSVAAEALVQVAAGGRIALVVDRGAAQWASPLAEQLAVRGVSVLTTTVPGGERGKDIRGLTKLWAIWAQQHLGRGDLVVAVGGGATTDLAGFAAATWQRGVRVAHFPTTVLAMADASVGGKTAIDLPEGKNLVGAFHSPVLVWLALETLTSLPVRQFRAGLAEIAKIFLLFDEAAWRSLVADAAALRRRSVEALQPHLLRAVRLKAEVVRADPRETAGPDGHLQRALLNLGHTVGHAIEKISHYTVLHGEAVALGLVAEAQWAEAHGCAVAGTASEVDKGLTALGLVTRWERWAAPELWDGAAGDKKRRGAELWLPVLLAPGRAEMQQVRWESWRASMAMLAGNGQQGQIGRSA